jgi:hypothetical protein
MILSISCRVSRLLLGLFKLPLSNIFVKTDECVYSKSFGDGKFSIIGLSIVGLDDDFD